MADIGVSFNKCGADVSDEAHLALLREIGYQSFFTSFFEEERIAALKKESERLGLRYESIHAPFGGVDCIWEEGEKGEEYVRTLYRVADVCAHYGISYFTLHCGNVPRRNIDVTSPQHWSLLGKERFRSVVRYAAERGVVAAFENVEFPHFELKLLLESLREEQREGLGFTWDVGHQHCYPAPLSLPEEFSDLLVGTHIHDNFGQTDPHVITWDDDSHILPFDGTIDFRNVARKLNACGYTGTLTLEIGKKPNVPWYGQMDAETYLREAYVRAERIGMMMTEKT